MTANILQFEITGIADAGGNATTLIDAVGNFEDRRIQTGDIIYNTTDLGYATISSIDSQTQITTTAILNASGVPIVGAQWDNNDGYQIWVTEQNVFDIILTDTLGFPMFLEALIANNQNEAELSYYLDYQKIRIIDTDSNNNLILFYGKIETTDPYWDNQFGQVLKISARDNLAELLKRTVRNYYTAAILQADLTNGDAVTGITRRNQLIKRIINDYQYQATNIDVTTADMNLSLIELTYAGLASNFTGAGKNALRAILELSQDESWNATQSNNTGFGFDYFLDTDFLKIDGTAYVSPTGSPATPSPDLHYFQRGTIPSIDPTTQGLTVQYLGTASTTLRQMLHDYNFSTQSRELITRIKAIYMTNATGNTDTLDCILVNHGAVAGGPFAINDIISWNGGVNTATVRYPGSTFLLISSANNNSTWLNTISGQTITSGAKSATVNATTATTPGSVREVIQQEIEVITREYEKESIANAAEKVAGLLHKSNDAIMRGEFSIVRYPYYRFGGLDYATRAGHLIRVINPNVSALGAGTNMIVTKIEYRQSAQTTRISVVGTTKGKSLGRDILRNMIETAETASWETVAATGGISENVQLVNLTKTSDGTEGIFTVVDADEINWVAATATYSDGSTQSIAASVGNKTFASATVYEYGYITKGSTTLSWGTYASALGLDRTIIAMGRINANTGQLVAERKAILVTVNEGSQVVTDIEHLKVAQLSALVSDLGFINAGGIRLASTATNIIDTTGFSGFTLNGTEIAGYSAGTRQAYILSSTGKLYAGGGSVVLDSTGIHFKGDLSLSAAQFENTGYETVYIYNDAAGSLIISPSVTGATDVTKISTFLNILEFAGHPTFQSQTVPTTVTFNLGSTGKIIPGLAGNHDLGDATKYWDEIYGVTLYIDAILRRSGSPGGNIGASNAGFTNAFFDNLYEASTSTGITLRNILKPYAANSIDLGTSSLPFKKLFIGIDAVNRYISGDSGDMEFYGNGNRTMTLKDEDAAANTTNLEIRLNNDSGVNVALVYLGAFDSGGAGYRVLRVNN